MPKGKNKELEAKRRLIEIDPYEVSVVDRPANDSPFITFKSLGGDNMVDTKPDIPEKIDVDPNVEKQKVERLTIPEGKEMSQEEIDQNVKNLIDFDATPPEGEDSIEAKDNADREKAKDLIAKAETELKERTSEKETKSTGTDVNTIITDMKKQMDLLTNIVVGMHNDRTPNYRGKANPVQKREDVSKSKLDKTIEAISKRYEDSQSDHYALGPRGTNPIEEAKKIYRAAGGYDN